MIISLSSYSVAVGFDSKKMPSCIMMTTESLSPQAGDLAVSSNELKIIENNLHFHCQDRTLVLESLDKSCLELISSGLPVVVLDGTSGKSNILKAS